MVPQEVHMYQHADTSKKQRCKKIADGFHLKEIEAIRTGLLVNFCTMGQVRALYFIRKSTIIYKQERHFQNKSVAIEKGQRPSSSKNSNLTSYLFKSMLSEISCRDHHSCRKGTQLKT